jgi:hypothetical protein
MKKFNNITLVAIVATVVAVSVLTYNFAIASHSFEQGASTGTLPQATTVVLAGQVIQPGDYFPIVDFSPNYVAGHLLVRIPCDANANPLVMPIAGHVDEIPERTFMAQAQLNYIEHASNPGKSCVYHSHIPAVDITDVGNPGAPRITDIGLLNTGTKNVVFRTANVASFTILNVVGNINPPNGYGPASTGNGQMPFPYNQPGPIFPSGTAQFDEHHHD